MGLGVPMIAEKVRDRLPRVAADLEAVRPGILDRAVQEVLAEERLSEPLPEGEESRVADRVALRLCQAALDLYMDRIEEAQADDVRERYARRIEYLREKMAQLERNLAERARREQGGTSPRRVLKV